MQNTPKNRLKLFWSCLFLCMPGVLFAQEFRVDGTRPSMFLGDREVVSPPVEGLWSVATGWRDGWMSGWVHTNAQKTEQSGEWTILSAVMKLPSGDMLLRDSYMVLPSGLVRCVRRYEWSGQSTLKGVVLSVRWRIDGQGLKPLAPGILYYGNPAGARVNDKVIPVYRGLKGEFAIFEDHRYPMPFMMLENGRELYAAAIHSTPSPVRGAKLADQWWSMGVEAKKGHSELVLYSGPVGYNGQRSVVKALQQTPMRYDHTYIDMESGQVVEKEFYLELYPIQSEGSGFQQPIYSSLDIHRPYDLSGFSSFDQIVKSKYRFAESRWMENPKACGWSMYPLESRRHIVMGWCGQAASLGYAMQVLGARVAAGDEQKKVDIRAKTQRSLDFLSTFPVDDMGMFPVGYDLDKDQFFGGDHVSCGQAMYNFAKAISAHSKLGRMDSKRWREFLRKACDGQAKRILSDSWRPTSTAESFYVAPLALAARIFHNDTYKRAAIKAADEFATRHRSMNEPYWGGTLDATCEDKEAAWAAFQGFLELYEQFGDREHLELAKHAMDVCLTYTVVWDIPLPAGRMADHNFKTRGWTVVSPQNQHIDVYGVFFAPEIYKMGTHLKDKRLHDLSRVMYRSCFQLTDPFGGQGEQLQQTNFAQHGDMSSVHKLRGGYSERWTVFWITAHFLNAAARFEQIGVKP